MESLLPHLRDWFLPKEEYFVAFAKADSRLEGWFKAELLILLNRLKQQAVIDDFQRELNLPRNDGTRQRDQIDFRIVVQGMGLLCELKALCISRAAGTPRNLQFYFREDHVGVVQDFKKLDALVREETKWVLGFVYPAPNLTQWTKIVEVLSGNLNHWQCVTTPTDFPKYVFLALWRQREANERS